jgi:hypothetical protein
MATDVFFGETERDGLGGGIADEDPTTRGLLESYPHDPIHRLVGGIIGDKVGLMANVPTAAFDPVFFVHHSNVDWLWAYWSCLPGKKWANSPSTFPSSYWFNERPWFFYDSDGKVINEPRKAFFNHRQLGIRFKDEDSTCQPLKLPDTEKELLAAAAPRVRSLELLADHKVRFEALPVSNAVISVPRTVTEKFQKPAKAIQEAPLAKRGEQRLILRLSGVKLGLVRGTGFDVHLTDNPKAQFRRTDPGFLGSINLFRHYMHPDEPDEPHPGQDETFDVTKAIRALSNDGLKGLQVVLVPYSLLAVPGKTTVVINDRETLAAEGMQFLAMEMK